MRESETFTADGMRVSVEESADALAYTFLPRENLARPPAPVGFFVVMVLYPLGLLALVAYARSRVGNRPEWEDVLLGALAAQLLVWLVTGAVQFYHIFLASAHPFGTVLKFTRNGVWHGRPRVCDLEQVRGLRLFVYPDPDRPGERNAGLSLVIDPEGQTLGLLGAFSELSLHELAEHIHQHLSQFRSDQGLMAALDALSVTEVATDKDAADLMDTRPSTSGTAIPLDPLLILNVRWAGLLWCTTMLAGLFASVRVLFAADFRTVFILPFCPLALFHFFLLVFHLSAQQKSNKRPK